MRSLVSSSIALALLTSLGFGQGEESACTGSLLFPPGFSSFDTNGRSTDEFAGACPDAEADLWWIGLFFSELGTFRTCGLTTMDSVLYA
jgi:hypothetical protein